MPAMVTFTRGKLLLLGSLPAAILLADDPAEAIPKLVAFVADDVGLLPGPVPHAVATLQLAVVYVRLVAHNRL